MASLRPYSWAKYWSRAGHDVTVLTISKEPMPSDSPQSTDGFRIIEVPIPGMPLLRTILGRRSIFNTSSLDITLNEKAVTFKIIRKFLYRIRIKLKNRYGIFGTCRMPDLSDLWGNVAFKAVHYQHWDLVVSTAGPYGVHRPAYRLKKSGIALHWITDWRDLWTDNHIYPGLPGLRSVEQLIERRWSQAADAITTVSEPLATTLREKYGNKVHVIYNGFDPEDYQTLPKENIMPDDGLFRIVYTGSIYAGYQNPSPLFEAISSLFQKGIISPERFRVIFCGANADFTDLAQRHFVEEFVEYAGFVPRQQALRMQRDANVLLFLEFESKASKGILTGKLFEYLFAGPPIMVVGFGIDTSVKEILERTGRGMCFGTDTEKIAKELEKYISGKLDESFYKRKIDYKDICEYSRKEQSEKMLNILT